ncbi:MAG: ComEC/Rec2 family competence protein [Armatimonadetes bacterium]|nr:ComEC/Rec2 family competence protein [Armatimonadota bacterium]MDW8121399.1 ComEC/Rec2 family competence protein [Armatimonadota bacterium]
MAASAVVFLAGVLSERFLPEGSPFWLIFILLVLLIIGWFARQTLKHLCPDKNFLNLILITFIVFPLGIIMTRARLIPIQSTFPKNWSGVLLYSPQPTRSGYAIGLSGDGKRPSILVFCRARQLPESEIGDFVMISKMRSFSADRRNRLRGYGWVAFCNEDAIRFQKSSGVSSPARFLKSLANRLIGRWKASFPAYEREFTFQSLSSLVFGSGPGLSPIDREALSRSGLAHLFVPSGSQISILMAVAWLTTRYLGLSPWVVLTFLLGFYLLVAQREPSIFRAVLMGLYAFVGWQLFRDLDWHTSLWLSGAVMAAWDPSVVYDVGFQLSFAATFGLLYATPFFRSLLSWLPDWIAYPVVGTLSAQLFISPLLLHYFGRVSLIAPITNLICFLPASLSLSLGLLSAFVSLLSPFAALPFTYIAGQLAKFILDIAHQTSHWSFASLQINPLTSAQAAVLLFAFVGLIAYLAKESAR